MIFQQIISVKFRVVAEKTPKNFRGLLYFAAPCSQKQSGTFLSGHGVVNLAITITSIQQGSHNITVIECSTVTKAKQLKCFVISWLV